MSRWRAWGAAFGCVVLTIGGSFAAADDWPARAIKAVVPLTAGSATDITGRAVLNELSSQLGQSIVVENRSGAGNTIGMAEVARSSPDGYTVLVNSSSHTVVPATFSHLPFDTLNDLVPVVPFGVMPTVIVVSPKKKYQSLSDSGLRSEGSSRRPQLFKGAGAGNFSHLGNGSFCSLSQHRYRPRAGARRSGGAA